MTLHCYCCGEPYERGQFRCCAAPANGDSSGWLEKHCHVCANDPKRLRTKCPRHCTCPKKPLAGVAGFATLHEALANEPTIRLVNP